MEIKAKARHIKISPRKTRLVADLVRQLQVQDALNQLKFLHKRAALPVRKLIESGVANAVNTYELKADNLYVKLIEVNEGPTIKRWMPRARGRATPIRKRTSHINLVLGELVDSGPKTAKTAKLEAPIRLGERAKEAEGVKVEEKDASQKVPGADQAEKGKKIIDPRAEGKGKNTKIEGKGAISKIFRRKSG